MREQLDERGGEEESPARSILGLGRVGPSSLWFSSARGNGGPPPTTSLLGLSGLEFAASRIPTPAPGIEVEPPASSLLGLQALRAAPLSRPVAPFDPDAEPPNATLLGLSAYRPPPGARILRPRPRPSTTAGTAVPPLSPSFFGLAAAPPAIRGAEPASRSFFGLQGPPPGVRILDAAEIVPEFEKDVEHRAEPAFPVGWSVGASLFAHALLLLFLFRAPAAQHDPRKGLLAALVPPPSTEEKVPIIFREAPGPARENPKKSDLSDADRRAGGGDPNRPRSQSPFVPERPGKQGLRPGPARPPSAPPVPPPGAAVRQAEAGRGRPSTSPGEGKAPESEAREQDAFAMPRSSPGQQSSPDPGGRSAPTLQGLNQAIKDAARGVGGGGEAGAGFPNPDGGFVDSGPLSFDTTWYDWGPYAAEMIRRIKLHWDVPDLARFGWKGKVTVRFFIMADGRVDGAVILSRSGVPPFDYAAFQAIVTSSPFRPLPKDLGSEREGVTVTFFYNIRPGESGGGSSN